VGTWSEVVGYQYAAVPGGCAGQPGSWFPVYQTFDHYSWMPAPPSQVQANPQSALPKVDSNVMQTHGGGKPPDLGLNFGGIPGQDPGPPYASVGPPYAGPGPQNPANFGPFSPAYGGYRKEYTGYRLVYKTCFRLFPPRIVQEPVWVPTWEWVPKNQE
jgi:hypothetical protein